MSEALAGKVFLLTGATEGIGKAAALSFARGGATVVIVARNREKGERVLDELRVASGNDKVELLLADLSRMADVRALAAAFRARHNRLDVLANNAGAVFTHYTLTADGLEATFALDHLSYFLLTTQLLDLLRATPGARVVNTSSAAHQSGKLDLGYVAVRSPGKAGFAAYADAKLANIVFTRELARRLKGTGVTANCFHPGFVRSGFGQNNPGILAWALKTIGPLFARSPEKGAETLIWLATSPAAASFSGEYFHDCEVAPVTARARDEALATGLWALSERLVAAT